MVDSCPPYFTSDEMFNILMFNFKRHYKTNRAPYGLYFHTTWFKRKTNIQAFMVNNIYSGTQKICNARPKFEKKHMAVIQFNKVDTHTTISK